jgi:exopolyphosphatase/guanosine-5'-triphosphate,3'-diphosphate pyrophosphatase
MNDSKNHLFGIIHIGSATMTLRIISCSSIDDMEIIEHVSHEVDYGEEVFQTKRISFASLNTMCRILGGFHQLLKDYGVEECKVVATTAIREAENSLNIIDQIRVRTGFQVDVLDMTKEIYYKFFGLYYSIQQRKIDFADGAVLLMDITSGGLGLTGWQSGKLLFQQNVHSGALRILENFDKKVRNEITFPTAVREYIHGTLSPLWVNVKQHQIKYVILSGVEANLIGDLMGEKRDNGICLIRPRAFYDFVDSFSGITPFKLMQRYNLSESRANVIMPTILLYYELLHAIDVDVILLMGTTFAEGYSMFYVADKDNDLYIRKQRGLLLDLTRTIGAKYLSNPDHSSRIEKFASIIFHAMYKQIGLDHNTVYLLRLASILHESGKFINLRSHNRHTYDLIMATDIFGITEEEKEIVANIGFYYGQGLPNERDENYHVLSPLQKMLVLKLVAIFRLADSLDAGHNGKITRITTEVKNRELIVKYISEYDISLERWTFMKAAVNFEEVFGITPILLKR